MMKSWVQIISALRSGPETNNDTMAKKYAMSVMAASVAETVTYPLDLTKTRLQLQGEIASGDPSVKYKGMFRTALGIAKEEGLFMLWRGMLPALYRHAIYTGIRMSAYEEIRNDLQRHNKDGFPLWKKVVAGMTAGGVGQLAASPTDLIKTQIQMEGRRRLLGYEARVEGAADALRFSQLFSRLFLRLERAILEKNALGKVAPEIVFQTKDGAIFSLLQI